MALDPQLVQDLLHTARQHGATAGDALLVDNESFEVQVRLGEVEKVQQSHQKRLGLRLFFGQRSATTSTSDLSEASLGNCWTIPVPWLRPWQRTPSLVCRSLRKRCDYPRSGAVG